jgi:hypothetical protein
LATSPPEPQAESIFCCHITKPDTLACNAVSNRLKGYGTFLVSVTKREMFLGDDELLIEI